jgi:hypothetical protein
MSLTTVSGVSARHEAADSGACGEGAMVTEIAVPDEWTPALKLATRELLQRAVRDGCPARALSPPEQLRDVLARIQTMMEESGLAA